MGKLILHRVFVGLSVLWAAALPIQLIRTAIKHGADGASLIGYSLAGMVLFFPWLIVLIPLLLVAHYTKPNRN